MPKLHARWMNNWKRCQNAPRESHLQGKTPQDRLSLNLFQVWATVMSSFSTIFHSVTLRWKSLHKTVRSISISRFKKRFKIWKTPKSTTLRRVTKNSNIMSQVSTTRQTAFNSSKSWFRIRSRATKAVFCSTFKKTLNNSKLHVITVPDSPYSSNSRVLRRLLAIVQDSWYQASILCRRHWIKNILRAQMKQTALSTPNS